MDNLSSWWIRRRRRRIGSLRTLVFMFQNNSPSSLLLELRLPLPISPILWCDNIGATYLAADPVFHSRMKHVEIHYHFVRELVNSKQLLIGYVSTKDQLVDLLTKALPKQRFLHLKSKPLRNCSNPAQPCKKKNATAITCSRNVYNETCSSIINTSCTSNICSLILPFSSLPLLFLQKKGRCARDGNRFRHARDGETEKVEEREKESGEEEKNEETRKEGNTVRADAVPEREHAHASLS